MQKKVDAIEKPGYEGKSSFWREKVDFIKTAGDKVYYTFWREKNRLHSYTGLNKKVFGKKKSTLSKNRAIKRNRVFGGKKST